MGIAFFVLRKAQVIGSYYTSVNTVYSEYVFGPVNSRTCFNLDHDQRLNLNMFDIVQITYMDTDSNG